MSFMRIILKSLLGLFVDDEFLVVAICFVVASAGSLILLLNAPPLAGGVILFLGSLAALALGVLRSAKRTRQR